jgi:hypothetical protein
LSLLIPCVFGFRAIAASPALLRYDSLVPLGICLENYPYPFEVRWITLDCQQQQLKMAYTDVRPSRPNGHCFLLLHGKNFCGAANWLSSRDWGMCHMSRRSRPFSRLWRAFRASII